MNILRTEWVVVYRISKFLKLYWYFGKFIENMDSQYWWYWFLPTSTLTSMLSKNMAINLNLYVFIDANIFVIGSDVVMLKIVLTRMYFRYCGWSLVRIKLLVVPVLLPWGNLSSKPMRYLLFAPMSYLEFDMVLIRRV